MFRVASNDSSENSLHAPSPLLPCLVSATPPGWFAAPSRPPALREAASKTKSRRSDAGDARGIGAQGRRHGAVRGRLSRAHDPACRDEQSVAHRSAIDARITCHAGYADSKATAGRGVLGRCNDGHRRITRSSTAAEDRLSCDAKFGHVCAARGNQPLRPPATATGHHPW